MVLNAGVFGAFALAGSQSQLKGMQMGGKAQLGAQLAALGGASSAMSGASQASNQSQAAAAGQTNEANGGQGSMEMQDSAGTNSL